MTGAREPGTDEYILRHKILFIGNSIGLQVSLSWKLPIVKCLRGPFTPHGGQDLTRGAAIWIPLRLILTTDDSLQRIRDIYIFYFFLNVIDYMTFTDEYQSHPQLLDQSRPIHTASTAVYPSDLVRCGLRCSSSVHRTWTSPSHSFCTWRLVPTELKLCRLKLPVVTCTV